jgi:hypothetical protein
MPAALAVAEGIDASAEALRSIIVDAKTVQAVHPRVNPRWLTVCDIKMPRTGLEVKFS